MTIHVARHAGFCFGVKNAVDLVLKSIPDYRRIYTYGNIIHNPHVTRELAQKGVEILRDIESLTRDAADTAVVIRSHGVPPGVYEALRKKGVAIIDATCPYVKRIHDKVRQAADGGCPVVIVGEKEHPEVEGIKGWAGGLAHVVYDEEDASGLPALPCALVVAQTTITKQKWESVLARLQEKIGRIEAFMSICATTELRQEEAEALAKRSQAVIVIGGRQSSNTRKLFETCRKYCDNTVFIENSDELSIEKMKRNDIISIVAGASTPDCLIREVYRRMSENESIPAENVKVEQARGGDGQNAVEQSDAQQADVEQAEAAQADAQQADVEQAEAVQAEAEQPEAVQAEAEQAEAAQAEAEQAEAAQAEAEQAEAAQADAEQAEAAQAEAVQADAAQAEAEQPEAAQAEAVQADAAQAEAVQTDAEQAEAEQAEAEQAETEQPEAVQAEAAQADAEQSSADFMKELDKSMVQLKRGQLLNGTVVQVTDEDVYVNIGFKTDGILTKSEFSIDGNTNPGDVVKIGDAIEVEVLSVNDGQGNVLLSKKRIDAKNKWNEFVNEIENDNREYTVHVNKAVKGGLLTRIEGYETFIPASQVDLKYVEDLSVYQGRELRVSVIDVDKRQKRIVASHKKVLQNEIRQKQDELWQTFKKNDVIHGTVKRLVDFGAFIDIGGVDGLLHIRDISWNNIKHPSDVLHEGDTLDVMILNVDLERRRVSLGLKQLQPKPWELVPEKYLVGDTVEGKVVRIVPFGAFVELEPGIDGLIHVSQVALRRLERVEDEIRVGDSVKAKVMEVNASKKKISLSRRELLLEEQKTNAPKAEPKEKEEEADNYELPPVQKTTISLGDFFPKSDDSMNKEQ